MRAKRRAPAAGAGGSDEDEEEDEEDPRYKNVDAKAIETIKNEMLETNPNTRFVDIAGLAFAKQTIRELIILPMINPGADMPRGRRPRTPSRDPTHTHTMHIADARTSSRFPATPQPTTHMLVISHERARHLLLWRSAVPGAAITSEGAAAVRAAGHRQDLPSARLSFFCPPLSLC